MSLEKKSTHIRLSPEMQERLTILAGVAGDGVAEHGAYLLEKMIVAEFHALSLQAERLERLGLIGKSREAAGRKG